MSDAFTPYPPELSPLLGETDRVTMRNVHDVLAFISRATELQIEFGATDTLQDDFSDEELRGFTLICRMLMRTLAYESPAKAGLE